MNRDKLNSINPLAAVQSAYVAVSAIQGMKPEEQVAGASLLLYVMASNLNLDISQLMDMSQRIRKDADSNYTIEIRALREYVREELR